MMTDTARHGEAAIETSIRTAQAEALLGNIVQTLVGNVFIAATTVVILWLANQSTAALLWLGTLVLLNIVRFMSILWIRRVEMVERDPERVLFLLTAGALVNGCLWALPALLGPGVTSDVSHAYVIFILCCTACGSIIHSTAYSRTAIVFAVPPLVTILASLLANATVLTTVIALDVALMLAMLIRSVRISEIQFIADQRERLKAMRLAQSLSEANAEIAVSNSRLAILANNDPLTGLGNRAAFNLHPAEIAQKAVNAQTVLLIIDLDRFKAINDTMGHSAGDRVLTEVALHLRKLARPSDRLMRLGGDEFAVMLTGPDVMARAHAFGMDVLSLADRPVMIGDRPVVIGSSVGLAAYPDHATTAETLFACADMALYAAKNQGRRRVCVFNPELRRRLERQTQIELGFEQALTSGAIQVFFQPQVRLSDRSLIGFEALIRWTDAELGAVRPPEIVEVARALHASERLTRHVARAAAAFVHVLEARGQAGLPVAINVSPRELSAYPLSAMLNEVVREAGISASSIEVEITEEAMLDAEAAHAELALLEQSGFRIAVDDFGTGNSSLAYLMQLRIDRLKIDRSFIHGIALSHQNQVLVSALVGMGRALGVEIVVEGVETEADAEALQMLGCALAQGYLFARPMPQSHVLAWIDDRNAANAARLALRKSG